MPMSAVILPGELWLVSNVFVELPFTETMSVPWLSLRSRQLGHELPFHMDPSELQKLCVYLNKFALPRAIVDFDRQRFVAWNTRFLARTGYSEEEIKTLEPGKAILLGDSVSSPPDEGNNPTAEFVALAVRVPTKAAAVAGHLVRSKGNFGYLMLHDIEPTTSTKFEQGRLVGREQERQRIVQIFHNEVSSGMLEALFRIELAKETLESADLPEAEPVAQASELLSEAVEKIGEVLEGEKGKPQTST
jgi:hypothetical protein